MRPQARRSGGPTCTSCQRPAAHHSSLISHRYQHSTPLPHSCVLRCRVGGLASCPKAAWVCCLRHVCTLPAPERAPCQRAACCLHAPCVLPAPLIGSARGGHASSTRQLSRQNASRSRAYCRWRAAAPPAAAGPRSLWRLISAWWPPWRCSSPWPWHQAGA